MRWIGVLLFFLFVFSFAAHAEKGGYIVEPYTPQEELIDTTGADATISFWELPLWIKIAYISGIILASLGLFKVIPIVLGKIILTKMGKFLRLFQNSGAFKDNEQKMAAHLQSETSRLILRTIFKNPGITNQELTDKFHVDKSTIHWHIQQFRNDNIVVFEHEGKYKRYFIKTSF